MTPATKRPIEFYFDFISPFGYFAGLRIDDLGNRLLRHGGLGEEDKSLASFFSSI